MKKIVFGLLTLIGFVKGYSQNTCGTASSVSYPISRTVTSYTNSEYWFTVTMGPGDFRINVISANLTNKMKEAHVYTGTCASLTELAVDTLMSSSTDSVLQISITNTVATSYTFKLVNGGTNTTFTITATTFVSIVGDIGFCPGVSSITLAANILNQGSSPYTYTWSPGGATTNSISVSSPTPSTYTLSYHDAGGTYTTTITTFTLPASACSNCEMVQNGHFESYQHQSNFTFNIQTTPACLTPSGQPISDPKYWISPTCNNPDYYNQNFPASCNASVPYSDFSVGGTGTPAHSGKAYAGFYVRNQIMNNYHEYIQEQLKCPLITGLTYNVSFYAVLGNQCLSYANNIGMYLSTTSFTSTANTLTYTPQINASTIVSGYGNSWQKISSSYIGNGEQYITVGNFFDDLNTSSSASSAPGASYGQSYYFVDDISITPATPTVTASSCQNGSVTITAYGAPNSTVTTWAGPSSYTATGSSITVSSPTATATYTCTVNLNGTCGSCSNLTQTVTVQPTTTCTGTAPSYTPATNYSLTATTAYATNDIYINGVVYTIKNSELRMAAGKKIVIGPTGTLVILGGWLHGCNECSNNMWQGIVVQNGGNLQIAMGGNKSSPLYNIIEDAVQAVYTYSSTTTTPIPTWGISDVIFNHNSTDIYIDSHAGNLSANTISNSIFTCRNLNSHSLSGTNFNAIVNDIKAATPLLPSATNPTDLTMAGARSNFGIYINLVDVNNPINVGSGSKGMNVFDNHDYGIVSYRSSLTAKNNRFQNLTGNNYNYPTTTPIGIGIFQTAFDQYTGPLVVGNSSTTIDNTEKNTFLNCLIGIATTKSNNVKINNNVFDNETTATTFSASGSYVTGWEGIAHIAYASHTSTITPEQMQFANNSLNNYSIGFYLDFVNLKNSASASTYLFNNTISGTGTSNRYCSTGMYLQQSTSFGADPVVPQDALSITSNTITNVNTNCIWANSVNSSTATAGFLQIYNNGELSVKYNPANTSLPSPRVAAVSLSSSPYTRVTYNGNIRITGFTGTSVPPAQYHAGIYANASANCTINCNTVSNTGEDFVFEGNCATANNKWQNNVMDYSQYGLVLRASGILGDQGSSTYPINDNWTASAHFANQTLSDNSNPGGGTTSKLYTQTVTCTYQPCTHTYVPVGAAYSVGTTLLPSTGSNTLTCGAAGTGDRLISETVNGGSLNDASDTLSYDDMQNTLINDHMPYPVYDPETKWNIQYLISSHRPDLTPAAGYENARAFALAEGQLVTGNYITAQDMLNDITPTNVVENNWKVVDNILIKLQDDTLNANDVNVLESVASQCPHSGGSIIWKARALLGNYYMKIMEYPNDCSVNIAGQRQQNETKTVNLNEKDRINLYPNPNNGNMYVEYHLKKDASLEITDISGNLVGRYFLQATGNKQEIRNESLINGIYLYRVISDKIITGKIVIMK